jgi:hypothetical protein
MSKAFHTKPNTWLTCELVRLDFHVYLHVILSFIGYHSLQFVKTKILHIHYIFS